MNWFSMNFLKTVTVRLYDFEIEHFHPTVILISNNFTLHQRTTWILHNLYLLPYQTCNIQHSKESPEASLLSVLETSFYDSSRVQQSREKVKKKKKERGKKKKKKKETRGERSISTWYQNRIYPRLY